MSGDESLFAPGVGLVSEDLERLATTAAKGEDRALAIVAAPGAGDGASYIKRIIPLDDEFRVGPTYSGNVLSWLKSPRVLVSEALFFGGPSGGVRVKPAAFEVWAPSVATNAQNATLIARLEGPVELTALGASASGRVDTIYAAVSVWIPSGANRSRRVKNTTTGVTSTNTVSTYRQPRVQIMVAVGTEGSSTPGAVPADSPGTTTFYFKLAEVALPSGYTSGAPLNALGVHFIAQKWERGGVHQRSLALARPAVGMAFTNADAGLRAELHNAQRDLDYHLVRGVFRHTGANAIVVVDTSIDWTMRMVRVSCIRTASQTPVSPYGNFTPPAGAETAGRDETSGKFVDTGWTFSGRGGVSGGECYNAFSGLGGGSGSGGHLYLFANGDSGYPMGALMVFLNDAPEDGGHGGDHIIVVAEALGRDLETP